MQFETDKLTITDQQHLKYTIYKSNDKWSYPSGATLLLLFLLKSFFLPLLAPPMLCITYFHQQFSHLLLFIHQRRSLLLTLKSQISIKVHGIFQYYIEVMDEYTNCSIGFNCHGNLLTECFTFAMKQFFLAISYFYSHCMLNGHSFQYFHTIA